MLAAVRLHMGELAPRQLVGQVLGAVADSAPGYHRVQLWAAYNADWTLVAHIDTADTSDTDDRVAEDARMADRNTAIGVPLEDRHHMQHGRVEVDDLRNI